MKSIKFKNGFTIAELLVYMGLMSLFLIVLTELFVSSLDTQTAAEALSSVDMSGRFINNRLIYDLQRGKTITTPASLGVAATSMQFTDIDGRTISYALSGNNLNEKISGTTYQLNEYDVNVSSLSFTRIGNGLGKEDTIRVSYILTSVANRETAGPEVRNFQMTVGLRPN